jgi:hypothetical protein
MIARGIPVDESSFVSPVLRAPAPAAPKPAPPR